MHLKSEPVIDSKKMKAISYLDRATRYLPSFKWVEASMYIVRFVVRSILSLDVEALFFFDFDRRSLLFVGSPCMLNKNDGDQGVKRKSCIDINGRRTRSRNQKWRLDEEYCISRVWCSSTPIGLLWDAFVYRLRDDLGSSR